MLTALDESFLHQTAVTFDQTTISDHRFYDRIWLGGYGDDGVRFISGLAVYKNTNCFDGYFAVYKDGRQYNLRLSRPLLPDAAAAKVGPVSLEIIRPLESVRLRVEPGAGYEISADLTFTGTIPAELEHPHRARVDGRVTQDFLRFTQLGQIDGWIEVAGERTTASNWFGARDRSWGVRPGMGGYDAPTSLPRAGDNPRDVGGGQQGFLMIWLAFETADLAGYMQRHEDGTGRILHQDGHILRKRAGGYDRVAVTQIDHALEFVPDTRVCTGGVLTVTLADGTRSMIEFKTLLPPWCYKGTGYDSGYDDEQGLGLHRGNVCEYDVYDVSQPENVVLPDGRVVRPWHRETSCTLVVDGQPGRGHLPVISRGPIERYKLNGSIINRRGE